MNADQTTVIVQKYCDELAQLPGETPAEPSIRSLLARPGATLAQLAANRRVATDPLRRSR